MIYLIQEVEKFMENVSEEMTKEELLDLFSKYDLVELTAMNSFKLCKRC